MTQVISPGDDYVHHDRLTHSLKVAQVARRIAFSVGGGLSPEVAHTAALCHDLGHPPFGHAAEEELMGILDGALDEHGNAVPLERRQPILPDSFEGNAQSFRIVGRIAARKSGERYAGLNLTARTLAAIQKYPWLRDGAQEEPYRTLSRSKWGAYQSESELLANALMGAVDAGVMGTLRSREAEVMDWADDISYAVHDTEDFYRAGLIPLHELKHNPNLWHGVFLPYAEDAIRNRKTKTWDFKKVEFDGVAQDLWRVLPLVSYSGDQESREQLHKFGSNTIDTLTQDLSVSFGGDLDIPQESRVRVEILKKLTRYFVIDRPELQFAQRGQRRVIRELFFSLWAMAIDSSDKGERTSIPGRFRDYCGVAIGLSGYPDREMSLARATADFICSLTDRQAMAMAGQLTGRTFRTSAGIASV